VEYRVDWDSKFSLNNWVQSLDMICFSGTEIGMLGSLYFLGWAILVLVVPPLSDKYGRWKIAVFSMAVQVPITFILMISRSYYLTCLCMLA
jgi:MFS family permease